MVHAKNRIPKLFSGRPYHPLLQPRGMRIGNSYSCLTLTLSANVKLMFFGMLNVVFCFYHYCLLTLKHCLFTCLTVNMCLTLNSMRVHGRFACTNIRLSSVLASDDLRFFSNAIPTFENSRSTDADVAGHPRYWRAMTARFGYSLPCSLLSVSIEGQSQEMERNRV